MTDIGPPCEGSPVVQDVDLNYASELRVIREYMSALKTSLPTDLGDGVTSTLQDLSRFKHVIEYFISLVIQRFEIYSHTPGTSF